MEPSQLVRLAVVETKVQHLEETHERNRLRVEHLEAGAQEMALSDREQKTNWRLAIAVGSLGGTLFIGVVLFIATRGPFG